MFDGTTNYIKDLVRWEKQEEPPPKIQPKSELDIKTLKYEDFMQLASQGLGQFKETGSQLIDRAKECDQTQQRVISACRVVFDATALASAPGGCAIGGIICIGGDIFGVLDKEITIQVCDKINKATQGVWRDLSFEQKLGTLGSAGIGLVILTWYIHVTVITYLVMSVTNIYTAKFGAELALNHLNTEAKLDRQKKLLEETEETNKID
ncbi:MAG: hypothetical protein AAGG81_02570 [Chlamydiota bacterium]